MSHLNVNHQTSGTKDLRHQSLFFPRKYEMDMMREYCYYAQNGFYGSNRVKTLLWIQNPSGICYLWV